jgi:Fe-S cluster assembly protein SufD
MARAITQTQITPNAYTEAFATGGWAKKGPGFVREARTEAMRTFAAKGFPTSREEAWRNTNIHHLAATHFQPAPAPARTVQAQEVAPYRLPHAIEMVFVDGHFAAGPSILDHSPRDATVQSLAAALQNPSETLEHHFARHADADQPLIALNTAFFQDGAFVHLRPGQRVEAPIHLLHLSTEPHAPTASHVRHLIVAGPRSEATVVESYIGLPSPDPGLTTAVTEMVAGEGSRLHHVTLQRENLHATHIGHVAIRQDRDSSVDGHLLSVGSALARNEVDAILGMEGAELRLNGLFLATGSQHVDCPTRIDHAVAHTTSQELYKGILDGAAHGVFLGNIKVRADAQKTRSSQTNKNLLLSDRALMDTTPQLEIHANDVTCSHGSTIGQLSRDGLFFLRSRGLDPEQARLMLTQAFAHEALERAPAPLQPIMHDLLVQWFACRKVVSTEGRDAPGAESAGPRGPPGRGGVSGGMA